MSSEINTQNINPINSPGRAGLEGNTDVLDVDSSDVAVVNSTELVKADPDLKYGLKKPPAKEERASEEVIDASSKQVAESRDTNILNQNSLFRQIFSKNPSERVAFEVNNALEKSDNKLADLAWVKQKAIPVEAYKRLVA